MTRKTANDFHPEVLKLFDKYVHGGLARRDFLKAAGQYVVAGVTVEALLASLAPQFARAQQVKPADARIVGTYEEFASPDGSRKGRGYLVKPAKASGKLPTVLVVHENRGLNPHIEDIARRLALDNFIAFAPDALFPLGGYPGDEDKARELFPKLDQAKTRNDFLAAEAWLEKVPGGNGKVGVVGFCYGGGISNFLATRVRISARPCRSAARSRRRKTCRRSKAPLLIHYAGTDERINAGWPAGRSAQDGEGALPGVHLSGRPARVQQRHDASLR